MKLYRLLPAMFVLFSFASYAQPVWSPGKRAEMEEQWMQDSLHITPAQLQKISPVVLRYQQEKDKAKDSDKRQQQLIREKDKAVKAILDKDQYKLYYRREKRIRAMPKRVYTGGHQPY